MIRFSGKLAGGVATAALVAYARSQRITLNTLVQGAWALLLGRHTGQRRVVLGATVAGRPTELPQAQRKACLTCWSPI